MVKEVEAGAKVQDVLRRIEVCGPPAESSAAAQRTISSGARNDLAVELIAAHPTATAGVGRVRTRTLAVSPT